MLLLLGDVERPDCSERAAVNELHIMMHHGCLEQSRLVTISLLRGCTLAAIEAKPEEKRTWPTVHHRGPEKQGVGHLGDSPSQGGASSAAR